MINFNWLSSIYIIIYLLLTIIIIIIIITVHICITFFLLEIITQIVMKFYENRTEKLKDMQIRSQEIAGFFISI